MSIYYEYATYGKNLLCYLMLVVVSIGIHLNLLEKLFVKTLVKIFLLHFLEYACWFMSIRILHMKEHSISVGQARYTTSVVSKYLSTATVKTSKKFYNTTFPSDSLFTKDDVSTIDDEVEKLTREWKINYRACIRSLIYLLSTTADLSFAVHKLARFSSNHGKAHFEGLVHLLR